MDYDQAYERFNLDKTITKIINLDYFDLINHLNKEITNSENIRIPSKAQYKRDIEHIQVEYVSNLKRLAFLLGQGIKPGGIKQDIILKYRPILEELVKKGQLKESILDIL